MNNFKKNYLCLQKAMKFFFYSNLISLFFFQNRILIFNLWDNRINNLFFLFFPFFIFNLCIIIFNFIFILLYCLWYILSGPVIISIFFNCFFNFYSTFISCIIIPHNNYSFFKCRINRYIFFLNNIKTYLAYNFF
jgi:hypothetical protein